MREYVELMKKLNEGDPQSEPMVFSERQLAALKTLLPKCELGPDLWQFGETCHFVSSQRLLACAIDHLCGEIERALLKREDVYAVNVRSDKSGQVYIELDAEESSWRWQSITEDRPTRLAALLAVIERLPGLGGEEKEV